MLQTANTCMMEAVRIHNSYKLLKIDNGTFNNNINRQALSGSCYININKLKFH